MSIQLSFHNTQFSVVHHDNQTWLTSKELAQALQYANDRAVTMIFNKHSDEFTQCMTRVLEVSTSGNIKACCRIFSLRGAHLIAMFARTPVAKEFRRWVLDVLDREVGTAVITPVKPVVKTRREEVYYENDIPVARRPIGESEVLMSPESCLEHVMRSGYVIIPCDELGKMTLDELWQMAEETRKLRDRVRKNYQELATRYDF